MENLTDYQKAIINKAMKRGWDVFADARKFLQENMRCKFCGKKSCKNEFCSPICKDEWKDTQ